VNQAGVVATLLQHARNDIFLADMRFSYFPAQK
jgi:hypothetical protein